MRQTKSYLLLALFALTIALTSTTSVHAQNDDSATVPADGGEAEKAPAKKKPKIVPMTIGSPAPELDIEHWIQDGKGHFAKVSEFEADKVYVVEFWATWCGPCISSMPHIVQLQEEYADRGVQVVSITRETPDVVETFLEKTVRGTEDADEPQTYRDLTSAYCLTADPDGSTSADYMTAAKQRGIPCAFIVGKDAKIEWIGHPMSMDEPLEQIVSNQWDRAAFAEEFAAEQKADEVMAAVSGEMRKGNTEGALKVIEEFLADTKAPSQIAKFNMIKFQVLTSDKEFADEASELGQALLTDESIDPQTVNTIAWNIYRLASAGRLDNEKLLKAAAAAAEKASGTAGDGKPYLLDTLAHLQHQLGDAETALKTQKAAIEAAPAAMKGRLSQFLRELDEEVNPTKKDEESTEEASEK